MACYRDSFTFFTNISEAELAPEPNFVASRKITAPNLKGTSKLSRRWEANDFLASYLHFMVAYVIKPIPTSHSQSIFFHTLPRFRCSFGLYCIMTSQPVKKFPSFFRRFRHWILSWTTWVQSTLSYHVSSRCDLILPSNLPLGGGGKL
jgi:hypothetical protein